MPANLRETDLNTGIFQVVITIPEDINKNNLERGEDITLTYMDYGPSGADSVGDDDRAVELSIETSNFGATLEPGPEHLHVGPTRCSSPLSRQTTTLTPT